jgi:hypothetical protein
VTSVVEVERVLEIPLLSLMISMVSKVSKVLYPEIDLGVLNIFKASSRRG